MIDQNLPYRFLRGQPLKLKSFKRSWERKQEEGTAASRHFPRSIDVVAWPVRRKFSRCRKFQKSCNEHGHLKCKLGVIY